MRRPPRSFAFLLALVAAHGCQSGARAVDDAALQAADADSADWLSYGRTCTEQRHSPLTQVSAQTVRDRKSVV